MSGRIMVTPEELQAASSQFNSRPAELEQMLQSVQSQIESLRSTWQGPAANKSLVLGAWSSRRQHPSARFQFFKRRENCQWQHLATARTVSMGLQSACAKKTIHAKDYTPRTCNRRYRRKMEQGWSPQ